MVHQKNAYIRSIKTGVYFVFQNKVKGHFRGQIRPLLTTCSRLEMIYLVLEIELSIVTTYNVFGK